MTPTRVTSMDRKKRTLKARLLALLIPMALMTAMVLVLALFLSGMALVLMLLLLLLAALSTAVGLALLPVMAVTAPMMWLLQRLPATPKA
jgi:hypothetical protein